MVWRLRSHFAPEDVSTSMACRCVLRTIKVLYLHFLHQHLFIKYQTCLINLSTACILESAYCRMMWWWSSIFVFFFRLNLLVEDYFFCILFQSHMQCSRRQTLEINQPSNHSSHLCFGPNSWLFWSVEWVPNVSICSYLWLSELFFFLLFHLDWFLSVVAWFCLWNQEKKMIYMLNYGMHALVLQFVCHALGKRFCISLKVT